MTAAGTGTGTITNSLLPVIKRLAMLFTRYSTSIFIMEYDPFQHLHMIIFNSHFTSGVLCMKILQENLQIVTTNLNLFMFLFATCIVILSYNIQQQNAPLLNYFFLFFTMSTCFEPESSSSVKCKKLYHIIPYTIIIPYRYVQPSS